MISNEQIKLSFIFIIHHFSSSCLKKCLKIMDVPALLSDSFKLPELKGDNFEVVNYRLNFFS